MNVKTFEKALRLIMGDYTFERAYDIEIGDAPRRLQQIYKKYVPSHEQAMVDRVRAYLDAQ